MTGRDLARAIRAGTARPSPDGPADAIPRVDRRVAGPPSWRKGDPLISPETAAELAADPAEDR